MWTALDLSHLELAPEVQSPRFALASRNTLPSNFKVISMNLRGGGRVFTSSDVTSPDDSTVQQQTTAEWPTVPLQYTPHLTGPTRTTVTPLRPS